MSLFEEPKPIELKVDYKRVNTFISDYCKNISRNFTFIKTRNPLPEGTKFVFKISVQGLPEVLGLQGSVRRVVAPADAAKGESPGMEVSFEYKSEAERARVFAMIEKLVQDNFGDVIGAKIKQAIGRA